MIPDRKFGRLIFSNPSPGIFTVSQDRKTALETDDPEEAKEYIKKYFAQMIDSCLDPLITAEGYGKPQKQDKKRKNASSPVPETPELFENFWKAYPRKTAKQAAIKAWNKLAPDERLTRKLLCSLEAQKQSAQWKDEGGRFIPHPATWLNGRRWEDECGTAASEKRSSSFDLSLIMEHAKTHKPEV